MSNPERLQRWRLVLGEGSEKLGDLDAQGQLQDAALAFLYDREGTGARGGDSGKGPGGSGSSQLTVPEWINQVHTLFPQRTREVLENDALERYGMTEMVTNPEVLARVEPSETLLKAVLATKHLMSDEVLRAARVIVRKVVDELVAKLRPRLRVALTGRRDPTRRSRFKVASNFDPKATIRANLKNVNPETGGMIIREPLFSSRTRRESERWQVIIVVDQSGSMVDSVIHSAVTASIFHGIPALKSHLVAFDTEVVDLTESSIDPVETLMQVQLGGGTYIDRAMLYAESLVQTPRRAMVVLITDLYEGGSEQALRNCVSRLCQQGTKVLVLGALNSEGTADWNKSLGLALSRLGARVAAMTPYDLADWVAETIR
ncbi:VWA domain-containing protein [Propionibacteriaceae bacterium Y1923]